MTWTSQSEPRSVKVRCGVISKSGRFERGYNSRLLPGNFWNPYAVHDMNFTQNSTERDVAIMIVAALNLDHVKPEDIDPRQPLFGDGLGLDSIDALELALEISKRYGFQIRSDDDDNRRIFASLGALAAHIEAHRQDAQAKVTS